MLEDYRWLVSDAAAAWLARVAADAPGDPAVLIPRLRKDLSAARAHLVVEQLDLRSRARDKFSFADQMFFTRKGLEQATDEQIAAYKAARFPSGELAVDLCCGIGGDLLALAARGSVLGCDLDPVSVILAQANLSVLGCDTSRSQAQVADALELPLGGAPWHIDPDRRPAGRRTTTGELFEPPLAALEQLLAAHPTAAIKLAPATILPDPWCERSQLEWLGSRGECRQQVAWCGDLTLHAGQRAATIVDAVGGPRTLVGRGDEPIPVADSLGKYLYEPHSAVLAAKLTGVLCGAHALAAVAPGVGYLTDNGRGRESLPKHDFADRSTQLGKDSRPLSTPRADPALAAFEILDVLPLDQKQLKTYCRERRIGRLEVKKRGVEIDPEKLRKAVIGEGENERTLIVTPLQGLIRAIVASRIVESRLG